MKIVAMVSAQGTACAETALRGREDTPQNRSRMEIKYCDDRPDAPVRGSWTDCSENEALWPTHEEMFERSPIKIGAVYVFGYPEEFETLDDYSAHRGQTVTVLRPCNADEADVLWDDVNGDGNEEIIDRMFTVQAADGWIGHAWESELLTGGEA